jgi:predicted ATPase
MKITFKNVGAIEHTELDLRPMTVIIGPNNSNKTYLAYMIYWFLKEGKSDFYPFYRRLIKELLDESLDEGGENSLLINLELFAEKILKSHTEEFRGKSYANSWTEYFQDTSNKLFRKTGLLCELNIKDIFDSLNRMFAQQVDVTVYSEKVFFKLDYPNLVLHFSPTKDLNKLFYTDFFVAFLTHKMDTEFYSDIFLLPAERNSFVITYKLLANRRFKMLRESRRGRFHETNQRKQDLLREQGDLSYPGPIEDFLDFLTDVELQKETINNLEEKKEFLKLADDIEKYIQSQNKTQLKGTKLRGKELKVNVKKDLNIDLYNASSSIKQLAPLLLYLRYRAKKNDLLIIDEPEMNLHPESQVKLLEALAILTNLGVSVLLTTHSPYFMSHLNNLVAGNKDNPKAVKKQAKSLYMQNENAFLRLEDVSAYEMKDNKLVSLKDDEYGIRWDTLSDVSVDVQQKYFEIFESGENSHNGK